jgi:hypothetical protein
MTAKTQKNQQGIFEYGIACLLKHQQLRKGGSHETDARGTPSYRNPVDIGIQRISRAMALRFETLVLARIFFLSSVFSPLSRLTH